MKKQLHHRHTAARRARLLKSLLGLSLAAASAHAANIDTYWTGSAGDGDWLNAGNWSNGLPIDRSPADVQRVFFTSTGNGAASGLSNNVTLGGGVTTNGFYVGNSSQKTLNLTLLDGASLTSTSAFVIGGGNSASTPAQLTVTGPASGSATLTFNSPQLAGAVGGSGSTITLSGAGLTVTDTGSVFTVGRQGNGHTFTVSDGVTYSGKGMIVSGTTNITSDVGNNHQLVVTGAGTSMTLSGLTGTNGTLGLIVGSRPLTGQTASYVQSGNAVTVSDGASLRVVGDNPDATVTVLVGMANYRVNNSITVSGTGSVLEVSGNVQTTIGNTSTSTYNNRLVVADGGTFKTDAAFTINNSSSIAANRRNILRISNGGTFASSSVVNNNGGLVTLAEGGSLVGRTLVGAPAALAVNINGTGRFEAAGTGLGDTVTVNIGNNPAQQAVFAVGLAGHSAATSVTIDSAFNFNAGSLLEVTLFGDSGLDSIFLGENASVTLGEDVGLSILQGGAAPLTVGSWQLFTGNIASITGSFSETLLSLPALTGELEWNLASFNAAGGWTIAIVDPSAIPEPSAFAALAGLGVLGLVATRRRRRA